MIKKLEKQISGRDVYQVPEQYFTVDTPRQGESKCEFFLTDHLEKVFPNERPREMKIPVLTVVPGEVPAIQLVYRYQPGRKYQLIRPQFTILVDNAPVPARLRSVEGVASDYPASELADDGYITTQPGLFPDLLLPMKDGRIYPMPNQYRAVWIDFPGIETSQAGTYNIQIRVQQDEALDVMGLWVEIEGKEDDSACLSLSMKVLPVALGPQSTLHTEWFHADSLCDFYNVPAFSEEHWRQIDSFIEMAAKEHAVNMLLTPVFTLPLNTGIGLERTTTQLVDVWLENGVYRFGFDKLDRWCEISRKHGITHLEIGHLFTQWGARATPKVIAYTPEGEKRIFGWDVAAMAPEYRRFLEALLPLLCARLVENGYDKEHVRFHISDEPMAMLGHAESYKAARQVVDGLLDDYIIMDALSDYLLYEAGMAKHPVPTSDHFQEFFDKGFEDPWVYYCTAQDREVPNRFMAQPSYRNQIMGVLIYIYGIHGFLHWGYNYYNNKDSSQKQNPFWQTSSGRDFPSGDAYLVYPGEEGKPLSSIRAEIVRASFDDVRLLELLEGYIGREAVLALIHDCMGEVSFRQYPHEASKLLILHERICRELVALCR